MTPLVVDTSVREALALLRGVAAEHPVNMLGITERLAQPEFKAKHMRQMTRQSVDIPMGFLVTFSIELNHPCGPCRHMSMSVQRDGRIPAPTAVWMIAEMLGFEGGIEHCEWWFEDLKGHGTAVNLVQPIMAAAGAA